MTCCWMVTVCILQSRLLWIRGTKKTTQGRLQCQNYFIKWQMIVTTWMTSQLYITVNINADPQSPVPFQSGLRRLIHGQELKAPHSSSSTKWALCGDPCDLQRHTDPEPFYKSLLPTCISQCHMESRTPILVHIAGIYDLSLWLPITAWPTGDNMNPGWRQITAIDKILHKKTLNPPAFTYILNITNTICSHATSVNILPHLILSRCL